ncbi:hypothetical protein HHI36_016418 [Cryptolaemus montrouzieri]|uniref:Uncharacterized protein n=1 Tax=Cryptolaemus montrouzieri TaxID=559131 RepID=A0ABD2NJE1_9CUCU
MSRFSTSPPTGLRERYVMQSLPFKSPKNTVKRMRKSIKTSEIETTNQFESLMEEDIDENLHEDNYPKEEDDKEVEGNRKKRERISPLIIRKKTK